jgi:hypothetical protein
MNSAQVRTIEAQPSDVQREKMSPAPNANESAPLGAGEKILALSFLGAVALFFLISLIDLLSSFCR